MIFIFFKIPSLRFLEVLQAHICIRIEIGTGTSDPNSSSDPTVGPTKNLPSKSERKFDLLGH